MGAQTKITAEFLAVLLDEAVERPSKFAKIRFATVFAKLLVQEGIELRPSSATVDESDSEAEDGTVLVASGPETDGEKG